MDNYDKKGINHILCSLLIRECEGFNNLDLSDFIETHGGELNYEVFEDGISISIKSLNIYFSKLFPLLELIINKPSLSENQFHLVRESAINSINKDKENPFNICFDNWRKIVYAKHPYAFNTLGYESDIKNITYKDVLSEYENFRGRKKYLISNNSFINGNFVNSLDQKTTYEKTTFSNSNLSKELRFTCSQNNLNQTIIMIGNQTCPRKSREHLPLKVLESYLSYGMSSALFKLFRETNGITYDVGVFNSEKRDNAPFLIYLSVSNKNAIFAFEILNKLWRDLLLKPIKEEEIILAKEKLKSSILINSQCLDEILQKKIQLISYGITPNSENFLSRMENITPEDIKKLMIKYFANPFLSVISEKRICEQLRKKWIKDF